MRYFQIEKVDRDCMIKSFPYSMENPCQLRWMPLHTFCTSLHNSVLKPLLIRAGEKFEELAAT